MPRSLRIHVPGAFYHVTMRGNHRQNIFFGPHDRQILSAIVAEVIERFGARVLSPIGIKEPGMIGVMEPVFR